MALIHAGWTWSAVMPSSIDPSPYRDLQQRCSQLGHPLSATLEVTYHCNLRCRHCYLCDHHDDPERELSLSEIISLFDQLAVMQTLFLTLTGGEFFLRPDAFDILQAARERGFVVNLFTNGTLLTGPDFARVAAALPRQVHISLLGLEELHDRTAGQKSAFRKTLAAMDGLRAEGVHVVAKIILTREAIPQLEALKELARKHADSRVISADLVPTIDNRPMPQGMNPGCEDLCSLLVDTHPRRGIPAEKNPQSPVCSAGRSLLAINPFGMVMPCIGLRREIGSLRLRPLKEIWEEEPFRVLRSLTYGDLTGCRACPDRRYCLFCPGLSWHEKRDLISPVPAICSRAAKIRTLLEERMEREDRDDHP